MRLMQMAKSVKVALHFVLLSNPCHVYLLKGISSGTMLKAVCERESMLS